MSIAISLLIAVIGALLYVFAHNPKLVQIGLVTYACGLLAFLLQSGVALQSVGIGAGRYR